MQSLSTCLAQLVERLKFKKTGHRLKGGEGSRVRVSVGIVYYIITKCLVVKKKKQNMCKGFRVIAQYTIQKLLHPNHYKKLIKKLME